MRRCGIRAVTGSFLAFMAIIVLAGCQTTKPKEPVDTVSDAYGIGLRLPARWYLNSHNVGDGYFQVSASDRQDVAPVWFSIERDDIDQNGAFDSPHAAADGASIEEYLDWFSGDFGYEVEERETELLTVGGRDARLAKYRVSVNGHPRNLYFLTFVVREGVWAFIVVNNTNSLVDLEKPFQAALDGIVFAAEDTEPAS